MTSAEPLDLPRNRDELRRVIRQVVRELLAEADTPRGVLGISDLERRIGRERSTIYRDYKAGLFPAPEYRGDRRVWRAEVIEAWEAEQAARPRTPKLRGIAARRPKPGQGVAP